LSKNSGFTLIELVVVVALLAMFSFISLPLLMNREDGGERRVLRRLAGTVKQLYNEATLTRDRHLLTFDLDRNSISAFRLRDSDGLIEKQPIGEERSLKPLQLKQVEVVGKGNFRQGQVSIAIFPLGWMEQTRLVLAADKGAVKILEFSPLTGSTKISDERPKL
jgi:general secretion pathway protein H